MCIGFVLYNTCTTLLNSEECALSEKKNTLHNSTAPEVLKIVPPPKKSYTL